MTIASTLSKKQYEGNGLATEFPLPFYAADKAHIFAVVKKGLELEDVTSNFSVDLERKIFTYPLVGEPLKTGEILTVYRKVPLTQIVDLENAGAFHPEVLERDGFDRIVMQIQQLDEAISRALKTDITDTRDVSNLLQELFHARDEAAAFAAAAGENAASSDTSAAAARAWAESDTSPDPADPDSKSAKTWAKIANEVIPFAGYETAGKVSIDRATLQVDETGRLALKNDLAVQIAQNASDIADNTAALQTLVLEQAFFSGDFKISFKNALDGFLLCDGSAVSRETYADLFAVIGTTFGDGDGSTTFGLPDLRGRFIQGAVQGKDGDLGSVKEAGLPDIKGTAQMVTNNIVTGAFYSASGAAYWLGGANGGPQLGFSASRSNAIYGNSNTVQPPAVALNVFIKY